MEAGAIAEILKQGLLGAICVAEAAVITALYRASEKERRDHLATVEGLQKLRVDDAKHHQAELLEMTRDNVAALRDNNHASLAVKESVGELKDAIAEYHGSLRESLRGSFDDRRTRK